MPKKKTNPKKSKNLLKQNQEFLELLNQSRLFNHLPNELIKELIPLSLLKNYPKGSTLLEEGQVNDRVFFLSQGRVGVYSKGEHVITLRRQGDIFGEMSIVSQKKTSATIIAETPVQVFTISTQNIGNYSESDATILQHMIYRVFAMILTEKLAMTTEKARQYESTNQRLKKTTEALRFRVELEKRVVSISTEFIHQSPKTVVDEVNRSLKTIAQFIGAECGYMLLFSDEGTEVDQIFEWYSHGRKVSSKKNDGGSVDLLQWFEDKLNMQEESLHLFSSSIESKPKNNSSSQSFICVPVVYENSIVGFLGFDKITHSERVWYEEDLAMLRLIGEIFFTALKHSQAETDRHQKERQAYAAGMAENAITVLHNIGNAITPTVVNLKILLQSKVDDPIANYLQQFNEKMVEHLEAKDLEDFLQQDEKGQMMLPFLQKLSKQLIKRQEQDHQVLDTINHQLDHVVEIITLQKKYANFESPPVFFDVSSVIFDVVEMMKSDFEKRHILITQNLEPELPKLLCDKNKLVQVLLNLLKNAVESIDVQLKTNHTILPEIKINVSSEDNFICFTIQDSGVGASEEALNRFFEFGFTTKEDGSGLGLHDCASFIQSQNGNITVSSPGLGKGISIHFTLPIQP